MRWSLVLWVTTVALVGVANANSVGAPAASVPFPARAADAPCGSAFAAQVALLGDHDRYLAARDQVLAGNVPSFLRTLVPIEIPRPASLVDGPENVTVFVAPDYLAVGSDSDWLTVPLDFVTGAEIARDLGFALPTTRIVDAVYREAAVHLEPIPLPPGPQMRSMAYILEHRDRIAAERGDLPVGGLVAGTKKDVVLTGRLHAQPDREAIYGWQHLDGTPIQPLSLYHGSSYADYSHGIRLVSETILVDGVPRNYLSALSDPRIAPYLSEEGPIRDALGLMYPPGPRS